MPSDLARASKRAAYIAANMPADLADLARDAVFRDVAAPFAQAVRRAQSGPVARRVAVTADPGVLPSLRVGGQNPVFSGGATGAQVFYGTEFGGGKAFVLVSGGRSKLGNPIRPHSRHSTRQFVPARPFVYPTFQRLERPIAEAWAAVIDPLVETWGARNGFA